MGVWPALLLHHPLARRLSAIGAWLHVEELPALRLVISFAVQLAAEGSAGQADTLTLPEVEVRVFMACE